MSLRDALNTLWRESDMARLARPGALVVVLPRDALPHGPDDAWALLDDAERERVGRKRRPDDRATTSLAYACHRLVLARVLHCDAADVPLFRDARGCPRLRGGDLQTSLSHADPFIAIAVSADGPVGVDVERLDRAAELPEIADRICHAADHAAIARLPRALRAPALLALWVRKEALLKAAGVGLLHEMDRFAAPAGDVLTLPGMPDGPTMSIAMLDGIESGVGAVAWRAGLPLARFIAA